MPHTIIMTGIFCKTFDDSGGTFLCIIVEFSSLIKLTKDKTKYHILRSQIHMKASEKLIEEGQAAIGQL